MATAKIPLSRNNIFAHINKLVEEHNALNVALPSSDIVCPDELINLVQKYMKEGVNNVAPLNGVAPLRRQITQSINSEYGANYDEESEITISTGTIQSIATAINTFIKEGDEVIVFEPSIESFIPPIEGNGGRARFIGLKAPHFQIEWEEVKKMISTKTRMIILNSPQNPTGRVMSDDDIKSLIKLTNGTNIIIVGNESFEKIVFDTEKHHSFAQYEQLKSRTLIVSDFGPVFRINGWGISYVLGPEKLIKEYVKAQSYNGQSTNTPAQLALAEYLSSYKDNGDLSEMYQGKRNYFLRLIKDSAFEFVPCKGTYYQILDYSKISNEPDVDFVERLIKDYGVATIPVSVFQHEKNRKSHLIRICFAKPNDILDQLADKLNSVTATVETI
ncbi:aminotransferase class I/II-fold pyridoxal phosphate-dependent enzyme [Halosquirtibacter xylanolyticus]|uniref:aminotransferase class I/II-fold pyridoxal phosphate-dependent enzyme n=1 Tax=Halosquirtibacter xylanolyticus TaxID=3374599 RepID=UPI003748C6CD|nr:aminotransferase class I/II-fold pyridoxal phosphate-dependent enzyme [Prolixibacteraceae bacterium]